MMTRGVLIFGVAAGVLVVLAAIAFVASKRPPPEPLDAERVDLSALDGVSDEAWARLRNRRIFFGHQSVGNDVIAGVDWILQRRPNIGLRVVAASAPGAFSEPGLIHGPIGVNGDARSKMHDFDAVVRGAQGAQLDIALMKFCYVDLSSQSRPEETLSAYQSMVAGITHDRPALRIVHATMPLTSLAVGRKATLERMLGRASPLEVDNIARGTYNAALRATFASDRIFDIAGLEAQSPGKPAAVLEKNGRTWPTLAPELTTDGGHLNRGGQVVAARELLLLLARQP